MDQWINEFNELVAGPQVEGERVIWDVLCALILSFCLSLLLAYFYRQTHRGISYSVSFVHTMILMGVTVSIIMVIIGSNIARAFALVGALSIIRFRNAVKESRDVAFIFMTMAIGMAAGTGFYLAAIVFALFASAMVYCLNRFQIGELTTRELMLKVHLPESLDYHTAFNELFLKFLREHSLLSVETIRAGTLVEVVYSIEFKSGVQDREFIDELRIINGNNKITLLSGQDNINV